MKPSMSRINVFRVNTSLVPSMLPSLLPSLVFLILLLIPSISTGDQSPFGPHLGTTNQIATSVSSFGNDIGDIDTTITLNTRIPDDARVCDATIQHMPNGDTKSTLLICDVLPASGPSHTVSASCESTSSNIHCSGIREIDSCDFDMLTAAARAAINYILGICTKVCIQSIADDFNTGEITNTYHWQCAVQNQAQCLSIAGMEGRIDIIRRHSGCQF